MLKSNAFTFDGESDNAELLRLATEMLNERKETKKAQQPDGSVDGLRIAAAIAKESLQRFA
ncbi:hypothetical protein FACS1894217_10340 [Clostridia bacterium]|nr:hypothetical protein FACS1894217_10340 [Clostridia bacterium]